MSVHVESSKIHERSNTLSSKSSKDEIFKFGRSQSYIEPSVTLKNRPNKSVTLGRIVSSEGLDLGLPGVYRAKNDSNVTPFENDVFCSDNKMEFSRGMKVYGSRPLSISPVTDGNPFSDGFAFKETTDNNPPKKPPRNKHRKKLNLERDLKNLSFHDTRKDMLIPPLQNNITKTGCSESGVVEEASERCESLRSTTVEKFQKNANENMTQTCTKPMSFKKSLRFFKSDSKKQSRDQLKASMSAPFDFKKISQGQMLATKPIDLLESHCSAQNIPLEANGQSGGLHYLSSRGRDDLGITGMRTPDLLSHLHANKVKTLSYQPSVYEKCQTITHRGRGSTFAGFKKPSWFSRHITYKKHYDSDPLTLPLLMNNIEPLDQSLMPRKDSHGSTEDEGMENNNHLDVKDKKKKDKDKKKDKKGKPPSRHGSDARQSDKVRSKLKKFIGRRPTMESLQERGLIKETVFGCPLDKLCDKQGTNIPYFVKSCVEEVEKRGLNIDGIYRVSGNLSHVQKLRYTVDREIPVNFSDPEWEDIHVITGALKMFLRELPEPVIPFTFFDKFIATCKISDKNSRHDATKSLIRALPKPNKETLKYLLLHFCKVVEHSESNRMQVQNIAIVFGPTLLLKPPELTNHHDPGGGHMAVYMMYQNQIIDYMLSEFKGLF